MSKLRFIARSLRAYIRHRLGNPIPFLLVIVPTKLCNLRCSYCEYSHTGGKDVSQLKTEVMQSIISQAADIGIPMISYSGGEPLLSRSLMGSIVYGHKKGIYQNLNTNATLIDDEKAKVLTSNLEVIRVSMDAVDESFDRISGVPGSFMLVDKGLRNILRKRKGSCRIGLNIVFREGSYDDVSEVIGRYGRHVDFISILPRFSFMQNKLISGQDYSKALEKVIKDFGDQIINVEFLKGYKGCTKNCDFGRLYMTIYSSGAIAGCPFIIDGSANIGNIYEDSLDSVIRRSPRKPECIGCYATCTTEISSLFRQNPIRIAGGFITGRNR